VVDFFCSEEGALALGRARVVVVLFGIGRTFAGLVVGLVRVGLVFGLVSRRSGSSGFAESSPLHSQYHASIAWMSFRSPARVFGLSW